MLIEHMPEENIKKLMTKISKIKNVLAVYLFGSQVQGKQHKFSDIDICIIGKMNKKEKAEILNYSLDKLDISFFEELPVYIQIRVFREGKPIFLRNEIMIKRLAFATLAKYSDYLPLIQRYIKKNFEKLGA